MASEIRTNTITSRAGLSTVTLTDSGPMFSGITTFVDNSTFSVGTGGTIHAPATNTLNIGVNNTESLRIDSNSNLKVAGIVTATHFYGNGANLSGLPAGTTINGNVANRVVLASGSANTISGASHLSFDGTNLKVGNTATLSDYNQTDILLGSHSGHSGMTILSGTGSGGFIMFSDNNGGGTNAYRGQIEYGHSSDYMRFLTASAEALRIDSSGRVLIGTTTEGYSPDAQTLTIAESGNSGMTIRSGASSAGHIYFSDATSGAGEYVGQIGYNHSSNYLLFATNSAERLRIDSSGRVIIGATSVSPANAYSNNLVVSEASGDVGMQFVGNNSNSNYASLYFGDAGGAQRAFFESQLGANGNFTIGTAGSGAIRFSNSGGEQARIDSGGRLLVNTTSASISSSELFEVKSTSNGFSHFRNNHSGYAPIYIDNEYTNTAMAPLICITDGGGNRAGFELDNGSVFKITGQGGIELATGGTLGSATPKMKIFQAGNIWIGYNNSPQSSYASGKGFNFMPFTGDSVWLANTYDSSTAGNTPGPYNFNLNSSYNGARFYPKVDGGLANYQGNNSNLCDERVKKDIVNAPSYWSSIKNIEIKKFRYKNEPDNIPLKVGVIAQQVESIEPDLVDEDFAFDGHPNDSETTFYKGVHEEQMMIMAIKALQEAITRIETLEQDNIALRARVTNLEGN